MELAGAPREARVTCRSLRGVPDLLVNFAEPTNRRGLSEIEASGRAQQAQRTLSLKAYARRACYDIPPAQDIRSRSAYAPAQEIDQVYSPETVHASDTNVLRMGAVCSAVPLP